jgi:hypothetical protein
MICDLRNKVGNARSQAIENAIFVVNLEQVFIVVVALLFRRMETEHPVIGTGHAFERTAIYPPGQRAHRVNGKVVAINQYILD